jgi:hypothetical protein
MTGKCFIRLTPGGQEDLLLHVSVLDEEDVNGNDAGKVEHVDVVLDSNLKKKIVTVVNLDPNLIL